MNEYYSKEELERAAKRYGITLPSIMMNYARAADVRKNVRAEWINSDTLKPPHCSACNKMSMTLYDFCPYCGADMKRRYR